MLIKKQVDVKLFQLITIWLENLCNVAFAKQRPENDPRWIKTLNKMFWLSDSRQDFFSGAAVPQDFYTRAHMGDFEVLQTPELIYCPLHQPLWLTILRSHIFTALQFSFPPSN